MAIVPDFQGVCGWLFSSQFNRRLTHRGYTDGFTKLLPVAGDDSDLAPMRLASCLEINAPREFRVDTRS
jgi:hypothetical protein